MTTRQAEDITFHTFPRRMLDRDFFTLNAQRPHSSGSPTADTEAAMHLTVDAHACGTTGQCVLIAPALFRQGADGVAEVIHSEPSDDEMNHAEEAIGSCPVGAIVDEDR
ncbi:ferredoxin [Amycolatopsis speibonae]|uniref:Ferredoxin n=1 Tax=Amycolatopsis speibonae TaxID=1450224 RepID=A0ABV7PE05_9PSEU